MNNLFSFEYETQTIQNKDLSNSRFGIVYGENGKVVHTRKEGSYHIISTENTSKIGNFLMEKGFEVTPFVHKDGEIIGLKAFLGNKPTKVGDIYNYAVITMRNNGSGVGDLSVFRKRRICNNGASENLDKKLQIIKVPHNITYPQIIDLMIKSLETFDNIIKVSERRDLEMDSHEMERTDVMLSLNKWFYENEMPSGQKGEMKLDEFRQLVVNYQGLDQKEIKWADRYRELREAFIKECGYNDELKLNLSKYTVYATITNYLSRRIEKSKSSAPLEIQFQRAASKVYEFV